MESFHILTVGWEPSYIRYFAVPVAQGTGIRFTHGLVGDARRLSSDRTSMPGVEFVALSKSEEEPLPEPDYALLARLEVEGIPTIRVMIQGDRVLRERTEAESLGYATLLARRFQQALRELRPDVVLATFDSLHSSMSLAVARSMDIPWVALAYPVIPDNLTAFCKGMTPDELVPIVRVKDETLRREAAEIIHSVRANRQQVFAFRPPVSLAQHARQGLEYVRNLAKRTVSSRVLGYDRFTWPTACDRVADIARRTVNALQLPKRRMLGTPPKARYAYYPLHMVPESSVDTWAPYYQNQMALIFQMALALPVDMDLVVKIHFGDPDNFSRRVLLDLLKLPRVRIARPDASGHAFLNQASLVFGIQGTACIEAALLGKPVVIFGNSPYQHFPYTERARRPDELHAQIQRLLGRQPPTDEELVDSYAEYLARYLPGRINNWIRPIEAEELGRLCECFRSLQSYLEQPGVRAAWYAAPSHTGIG